MSDFLKSQREAIANLTEQIREVVDIADSEKRSFSGEELAKIEKLEADISSREDSISVAKRAEERSAQATQAAASFEVASTKQNSDADILRSIASGEIRGYEFAREARTLVPSTNTVGQSFYDRVFEIAQLVGPMLTTSEVFNTTSG
jgi:hypothetical protein